ncbi:MAG TPA: hypothetical protein VMG58_04005 [Candidatus Sulfotelmatobacter sp.]|nr:hypothetical protein [Candidatus Sulfotelmatobacter sp.]
MSTGSGRQPVSTCVRSRTRTGPRASASRSSRPPAVSTETIGVRGAIFA